MSDVFISYSRSDRQKVKQIAEAIEESGYTVWWDLKIPPGKTFPEVIEEEITKAKCVVVIWSVKSVKKDWVLTEAAEAKEHKKLVPTFIEDVVIPLEFRRIQAADLRAWKKHESNENFLTLLDAITNIVGHPPKSNVDKRVDESFEKSNTNDPPSGLFNKFKNLINFKKLFRSDFNNVREKSENILNEYQEDVPEESLQQFIYGGNEYIYILPGSFKMGTNISDVNELNTLAESEIFNREVPEHQIDLNGFYIGRYPVTNADYADFLKATNHRVPYRYDEFSQPYNWDIKNKTYAFGKGKHPVVLVSWHDAQEYCKWLGGRLPTEAEWEKACRGPDALKWPWGNNWEELRCNSEESDFLGTTEVGKFSPKGDSPYGISDMAGNVWEWCNSLDYDYPYNTKDGREEYASKGKRVLRGGAHGIGRLKVRCAFRNSALPDDFGFTIGFRVVFDFPPSEGTSDTSGK